MTEQDVALAEGFSPVIETTDAAEHDALVPAEMPEEDEVDFDTSELSEEMAKLQKGMQETAAALSDPTTFDPKSENYNPLAGADIGAVFRQFLQFTQSMGIRTVVDLARVSVVRHINGQDVEVRVPMKRSRVEDIILRDAQYTPEEYEALVEVLQTITVRDREYRARMKAKRPTERLIPSSMKTRGISRTARRAMKKAAAKNKTK